MYMKLNKEIQKYNLNSAFLRYEHYFDNVTLYGGLGHAERSPDFWEMNKDFANNSLGVARKEKNTQLDIGAVYKDDISEVSANLFYLRVNDYILMTSRQTLNTDALIYGGDMDGSVKLFDILKLGAGISYTKGKNLKNITGFYNLNSGAPLPQIAPLQAKFEVGLEKNDWFAKSVVTAHKGQHKIAKSYGNIAGMDTEKSGGFATVSLYGGYKYKNAQFLLGAENLTNKQYAYHVSKQGASIPELGIEQTSHIYEPGRNYWLKVKLHF